MQLCRPHILLLSSQGISGLAQFSLNMLQAAKSYNFVCKLSAMVAGIAGHTVSSANILNMMSSDRLRGYHSFSLKVRLVCAGPRRSEENILALKINTKLRPLCFTAVC